MQIDARRIHVVFLRDEIHHIQHVLFGALIFLLGPAGGRRRRGRPRDLISTAVIRLAQAAIAHRRDDDVAVLRGDSHEVVVRAVRSVNGIAGAQRHEHRQLRRSRPARRHVETIRNRLTGAGKVVDPVLLAGGVVERGCGIGLRRRRRAAAALCLGTVRVEAEC